MSAAAVGDYVTPAGTRQQRAASGFLTETVDRTRAGALIVVKPPREQRNHKTSINGTCKEK